jgi:hypothetical protein
VTSTAGDNVSTGRSPTSHIDGSRLGAPASLAAVHAELETQRQTVFDLRAALNEPDEELAAARETNRRLINELNRTSTS